MSLICGSPVYLGLPWDIPLNYVSLEFFQKSLKPWGTFSFFCSGLDFDLSFPMQLWVSFHLHLFKNHPGTHKRSPWKRWYGDPAKMWLLGFLLQPRGKSPPQPELWSGGSQGLAIQLGHQTSTRTFSIKLQSPEEMPQDIKHVNTMLFKKKCEKLALVTKMASLYQWLSVGQFPLG